MIPLHILHSDNDEISKEISKEFYNVMPYVINLKLFILTQNNNIKNDSVRKTLGIIYVMFLICWIYILLTANYTPALHNCLQLLQLFQNNINPFSDIIVDNYAPANIDDNETTS